MLRLIAALCLAASAAVAQPATVSPTARTLAGTTATATTQARTRASTAATAAATARTGSTAPMEEDDGPASPRPARSPDALEPPLIFQHW